MTYPFKRVHITQEWGVNGDVYSRFGFSGHNGIDLRVYAWILGKWTRSINGPVFAPHDGVVKERRNDALGYGNYLKIENDVEGSILAHLKEFKVGINKHVKQGDLIAIADNTGWSTGAHLHWGYYRHPRDRKNGYGGTIDPTPYINNQEDDMSDCCKDLEKIYKHTGTKTADELMNVWDQEKEFLENERKKNEELKNGLISLEHQLKICEEKELDDCLKVPMPGTIDGWTANGLSTTTDDDGKMTTTINYKKD